MPTERSFPIARIAAEGVVIVVSIMLALAADAWLEQRGDLRLETAELTGLRQQLIETREDLATSIRRDERILESTNRFIEIVENEPSGTVLVVDSLLRLQGLTTLFEPPLSRFEAIAASGRLVLIQDDALRAAIAGWSVRAIDPTDIATRRREFFEGVFLPELWADHDLEDWFFFTPPSGELVSVSVNKTFKNLLRQRQFFDRVVLMSERTTLEDLDNLLRMIEAALPEAA